MNKRYFLLLMLLAVVLPEGLYSASTFTWDGGGIATNSNWSNGDNWSTNVAPGNGSGDSILFAGNTGLTPNVDTPWSLFSLKFTGATGSYTIGGEAITLTGTTAALDNNSSLVQTIDADLVFSSTSTASITVTGTASNLILNGDITSNANTGSDQSLFLRPNGSGNNVLTINGVIGGPSGASIYVKTSDNGTLYLNNSANRISQFTHGVGKVYLGADNALGDGVALNLTSDGSFVYLNGHSQRISSLINSGLNNGRQRIYNGTSTAGTLTYDRSGSDEAFTGALSDSTSADNNNYALVKTGTNTLTLLPAAATADQTIGLSGNRYSGGTTINGGTLLINTTLTSSTVMSGTGTGAVAVNAGTRFGGNGLGALGSVTVAGTGILRAGVGSAASGTLILGGNLTMQDASVIELALGSSGTHSTLTRTGSGTWTFDSDQSFTLLDFSMEAGSYDNVITGLASSVDTSLWSITNSGWSAVFTYDGSGNVDLTLSAVPEPSAVVLLTGGLTSLFLLRRRKTV